MSKQVVLHFGAGSLSIDNPEMEKLIDNLLWSDWDAFFKALTQIAKEENERQVISTELKEWWRELRDVLVKCPYDCLPRDD